MPTRGEFPGDVCKQNGKIKKEERGKSAPCLLSGLPFRISYASHYWGERQATHRGRRETMWTEKPLGVPASLFSGSQTFHYFYIELKIH